jgi:hypothetical protein
MEELLEILEEMKPGVDFKSEKHLIDDKVFDSLAIMALVAASIIEPGLYFAMNTPPAGLGIVMPNLHEMGGENAAMIAADDCAGKLSVRPGDVADD